MQGRHRDEDVESRCVEAWVVGKGRVGPVGRGVFAHFCV